MYTTHDGDRVSRYSIHQQRHALFSGNRESVSDVCIEELLAACLNGASGEELDAVQLRRQSGYYGASIPELDRIVDVVSPLPDVLGAGLMGAGGTGAALLRAPGQAGGGGAVGGGRGSGRGGSGRGGGAGRRSAGRTGDAVGGAGHPWLTRPSPSSSQPASRTLGRPGRGLLTLRPRCAHAGRSRPTGDWTPCVTAGMKLPTSPEWEPPASVALRPASWATTPLCRDQPMGAPTTPRNHVRSRW